MAGGDKLRDLFEAVLIRGHISPSAVLDLVCRTAFRMGYPLARLWWRLTRPRHEGAVVAVYVDDRVLLVRSSYRAGWDLPGGGVRRKEAPEAAARRELAEEIGLPTLTLCPVCVICGTWDGRRDRVHVFEQRLAQLPELTLDNREIVAARLVPLDELGATTLTGPAAAYLTGSASD
jgi:8-oxo-dGTP diphosphatase